jgi:hypothetical protein
LNVGVDGFAHKDRVSRKSETSPLGWASVRGQSPERRAVQRLRSHSRDGPCLIARIGRADQAGAVIEAEPKLPGTFPVIAHHLDRDVIACDTELENVQKTRARLGLA